MMTKHKMGSIATNIMKARKPIEVAITGMHCDNCEILLERRIRKIPGVTNVIVNRDAGVAAIECKRTPTKNELEQAINKDGYRLAKTDGRRDDKLSRKEYAEIGAIFLILVALYTILKYFDFLPNIGISEGMGLGVVFIIGLIAATSTCLAVTGGLLLALSSKYSEQHPSLSGKQKFKPTLYFNIGRVAGYAGFGALLGAIGSLFAFSPVASGTLTVVAAAIMILLGLQMLRILPFLKRIKIKTPKFIAHRIYEKSSRTYKPWAPFVMGAGSFFLPCGFTQALQLYVLAQGSAFTGATTMFVFSLGTLPMLLAVGAISSFSRGAFHKHFVRAAAILVVLLGVFSLPAGIALLSLNGSQIIQPAYASAQSNIELVDGVQVARMNVNDLEYSPSQFIVKQGTPVRWEIDGKAASGCGQVITAPAIKKTEYLKTNDVTIIEFTPQKVGTIPFSCTMGMTTPGARFDVIAADLTNT